MSDMSYEAERISWQSLDQFARKLHAENARLRQELAEAKAEWETLARDTSLEDEVDKLEKQIAELREALKAMVGDAVCEPGSAYRKSRRMARTALANTEKSNESNKKTPGS